MKLFYLLVALAAGVAAWMVYDYTPDTLRYRWTIEVDTPFGPRADASIIEVRVGKRFRLMGPSGVSFSAIGEAPSVMVQDGSVLFALLGDPEYLVSLPTRGVMQGSTVPSVRKTSGKPVDGIGGESWYVLRRLQPLIILDPRDYPKFAWFRRMDDPSSVVEATASELNGLGPGYAIGRVMVQPTNDPISRRIDRILPWLASTVSTDSFADQIGKASNGKVGVLNFRRKD